MRLKGFTLKGFLYASVGIAALLGSTTVLRPSSGETPAAPAHSDEARVVALELSESLANEQIQRLLIDLKKDLVERNPSISWSGCANEEALVAAATNVFNAAAAALAAAQANLNECQSGGSGP